ncbi:hypothetical protein BD779DRAFT_102547 [Infundibulicybe gibba]|nr:hypothetical protein BD779DRAFT_102547 [Infundibulicybe gibba]
MLPNPAGTPQTWAVILFEVLQSLALLLLVLVLLPTLLLKSIVRTRTWISLMSCSIVFCISFLVLPLAGFGAHSTQPPPHGLCLFQACLIYTAPVLSPWKEI